MTTQSSPSILPEQLQSIFLALQDQNLDAKSWMRDAGLPENPRQLIRSELIHRQELFNLGSIISERLDDEQQTDLLNRIIPVNTERVIQALPRLASATIEQALYHVCKIPVGVDENHFALQSVDDHICLVRNINEEEIEQSQFIQAYIIHLLIHLIRRMSLTDWSPKMIFVSQNIPLLRTPLNSGKLLKQVINTQQLGIGLDPDLLILPYFCRSSETPNPLYTDGFSDFCHTLERALTPYFVQGRPTLEKAALLTGFSERTIQRKLSEEGSSYSQLLDQISLIRARWMLQNTQLQISEIALELGYSMPTHFVRSFKRLMGITPLQFRKRPGRKPRSPRSAS